MFLVLYLYRIIRRLYPKTMKGKLLILALLSGLLFAQCSPNKLRKRSVVKVALMVDSVAMVSQRGYIPAGFSIKLNNGKTKATAGLANGMWGWGRFIVKAENAVFTDGNLVYDPADVLANNKKIRLIVRPRNNANYTDTFIVDIPKPVKVDLGYSQQSVLAPEHPIKMTLNVLYDNGYIVSSTKGDGSFLWDLFDLEYDGKTEKRNTIWVENPAPKLLEGTRVGVRYKYNDTIVTETFVPIDYKVSYAFNYSGEQGQTGWDGDDAYGYKCSNNSQNGQDGNHGNPGGHGENGKNVLIYTDIVYRDDASFLLVKIVAANRTKTLYINMDGGKIGIDCRGGKGGNGGDGGRGSDGASETKKHEAGNGGNGGSGGSGGNGGNGGTVIVYTTKAAKPYLGLIQIDNRGGDAGSGGEGGKSGRGGSKEKATFFEILFGTNRGFRGSEGYRGNKGNDGPPLQILVLPDNTIRKVIETP